jgi:hypothetical protein
LKSKAWKAWHDLLLRGKNKEQSSLELAYNFKN